MRRDHFGEQHPLVAVSLHNLAHVLSRQGRHDEAAELFREALAIRRAVYGDEHPLVAMALYNLGTQLVALGRRPEGEDIYRQALAQQRKLLGDHHPEVRVTLRELAQSRLQDGDYDEAVALLREALAIAEWLYPEGHPEAFRRFAAMGQLGSALARQAKALLPTDRERALALFEEAERLSIGGMNGMEEDARNRSLDLRGWRQALERAVTMLEFWHKVAPDRGWGDQAAELRAELENLPEP
jgi:tetratricopeptide (TPR) repeat protein